MVPTRRYILFGILSLGSLSKSFAQQDPLYSQYHFNQQVLNPAYTGINENTNVTFISRVQWTGIKNSPFTNTLAGQTTIAGNKVGLGAMFVQDNLGIASNFEAHFMYSYKLVWSDKILSFGLQTSFIHVNYNFADLNLKSPNDPAFQGSGDSATKPNFGTGVALMSDHYFIGISAPRLLSSNFADGITSDLRYKRHYYGSFAYLMQLNPLIKFRPSVLVRIVDGAPVSYDINAMLLLKNMFWVGAFTRSFDSAGLILQVEYKTAYRFGYNFEIPTVSGVPGRFTTHEIMLSIDLALFGEQDVFQRFF